MIRTFIFCSLTVALLAVTLTFAWSDMNTCKRYKTTYEKGSTYEINDCYVCTCEGFDFYRCDGTMCPSMGDDSCTIGDIQMKFGEPAFIGCQCKCTAKNVIHCDWSTCSANYYIKLR